MNSIKYPRTWHLPWSDTIGPDGDHVLRDLSRLQSGEIVVTEKLDGENTTLYRTHLHARSLDGRHHVSRGWIKNFHAAMCERIPEGWRLCGESCFAVHSIFYQALPSYFLVFNVHDGRKYLSWDALTEFCRERELCTVPLLYRGAWDEKKVRACHSQNSQFGGAQEGYVVRLSAAIQDADWSHSVAKYVRPHHVQSGRHWMFKPVEKNQLAADSVIVEMETS